MTIEIFNILQIVLGILGSILPGSKPLNLADEAVRLAKAANDLHVAQAGKPIDPTLLTPEQPV